MSTTKAAAVVVALASGTCNSADEPAPPAAPTYACANAFDVGCRYRADVSVTGGTLVDAAIAPLPDWGVASSGTFTGLSGTVTLTDAQGIDPAVTCGFTVDLAFHSDIQGGRSVVSVDGQPTLSAGCPATCAWFLPTGGDFASEGGQFRLKMFEGQWELELGASDPDEPEYGPLWLYTGQSAVEFGEGVALTAPVGVAGGAWAVPMAAPPGSHPDDVCL
ncbi:MAG: hypothetical protein H6737_29910 [Alphaproteobacteria bacterium]|nr:hypothetical protein [Alphaproteobacteria bacterium]